MALPVRKVALEEYFAMDLASDVPLEYHDGEVFPIAVASLRHGMIEARLTGSVIQRLAGTNCHISGTVRIRVSPTKYLQPDLIVYCGKPELTDDSDPSLTNPKVVIEILSPSTAGYDYSRKFELYRMLPSFEEYVLVAQDRPHVDVFRRSADGKWIMSNYEGEEAAAKIESLELDIHLKDIYADLP